MTALDHAFIKAYVQQDEVSEPARVDDVRAALDVRVLDGAEGASATASTERRRAGVQSPAVTSVGLPDTGAVDALTASRPARDVSAESCAADERTATNGSPALGTDESGLPILDNAAADQVAKSRLPVTVEDFGVPPGVCCYEEGTLNRPAPTTEASGKPFRPAQQTGRLQWPAICRKLTDRADSEVGLLADAIAERLARDKRVVGMGSLKRGEGSTTLLLCAARRLAQQGRKTLLVDADLSHPQLPASLGLESKAGWLDVLSGRVPLEEAVIESAADGVALLPLGAGDNHLGSAADGESAEAADLDVLRAVYDCVLIDLGSLGETSDRQGLLPETAGALIDAVVLVQNTRTTSREELLRLQDRFTAAGIDSVGIAENFVLDDAPSEPLP